MDAPPRKLAEATGLLKNRAFRLLWIAQFSAVTVIYGISLAGAALVEERTHSSAQTGLVILSAILPAFLGSLVAGPIVDRWGKKRALATSHLARALVALMFWAGTLFPSPALVLAAIYAANALIATFSQFALTSELALLPDLVERFRLLPANAFLQVSMLLAEGLGIVLMSPLAIKFFGASSVGLIGFFLCLFSFLLATALPQDTPASSSTTSDVSDLADLGTDLRAGWRIIVQDKLLLLVAVQATVAATLLLVLVTLLPGLISRHLGLGVEDVPFVLLPGGLGFVLGTFLVGRWERWLSRQRWIAAGLLGLGVGVGGLALASRDAEQLGLVIPLIIGIGLTLAMVIVPARTVLQERPPAEMRGRVIAAQLALANVAAILPLLLGGSLADQIGILPVMGVLGLIALGAGVGGFLYPQDGGAAG